MTPAKRIVSDASSVISNMKGRLTIIIFGRDFSIGQHPKIQSTEVTAAASVPFRQ